MLIQEVILENFMSYEYARVPFKQGVNIIGGPNGAGKSSLLLAISVGLGQTYTERSRKLSDLIRWGKDQARVTLILDNSKQGNKRPVSKYSKDQLFLTRVLRRDGKYFFELENRVASKQDIERLLGKFEDERQASIGELDGQQTQHQTLKGKAKAVFEQRLSLEREVAQNESTLSFIEQLLSESQAIEALANRSQFK